MRRDEFKQKAKERLKLNSLAVPVKTKDTFQRWEAETAQKATDEAAAAQKATDEAAAAQNSAEEAETAQNSADESETAQKAADEAAQKVADESEAAQKVADESEAAQKAADESEAAQKAADEAAQKAADEAAQKVADEAEAQKAADQAEAAQKAADEAAQKAAEETLAADIASSYAASCAAAGTTYSCPYDIVALFGCDPSKLNFSKLKSAVRDKGWTSSMILTHKTRSELLELISLAPPEKAEEALAAKKAAEEAAVTAVEATETDAGDYDPVAFFAAKGYDPPEELSFPRLKRAMGDLGFSTVGIRTKTEFLERIACGPPGTLPPKTYGA